MPTQFAPALASAVVAVDVGKRSVALSVTDSGRVRLLGPVEFAMTRPALQATVDRICQVLAAGSTVRVGVEAAGRYHLPVLSPVVWPAGWQLVALNPAHVAEQRRVSGRRWVKTDALDLEAITELLLAGRGARGGLGIVEAGDVELDDQQVIVGSERSADALEMASGGGFDPREPIGGIRFPMRCASVETE